MREKGTALKLATLSFDDGLWHDIRYLIPKLDKWGVKATFYLCSNWCNYAHTHVGLPQIRLAYANHEVGCHTANHAEFRGPEAIPESKWEGEIGGSRKWLQAFFGQPVECFAYPFGWWMPSLFPYLDRAGFRWARTFGAHPAAAQHPIARWTMHMTAPIHPGMARENHPIFAGRLLDKWDSVHFVGHSYQLVEANFWDDLEGLIRLLRDRGYALRTNSEFFTEVGHGLC